MRKAKSFIFIGWIFGFASLAWAAPEIEIFPAVYDFGDVEIGAAAAGVIQIRNIGDSTMLIDQIDLVQDGGQSFAITSFIYLPVFVGRGGSFSVDVSFTPAQEGSSSAVLEIGSNDPDDSTAEAQLTGQTPAIVVTEEPAVDWMADLVEFVDQSIADLQLVGIGPGKSAANRLRAFCNQLRAVEKVYDQGNFEEAADHLRSLYKKADGLSLPPDFVTGPAKEELTARMEALLEALTSGD